MICAFYVPLLTTGYLSYGDSIRESIINSIKVKWIQQAVNIMLTLHCTCRNELVVDEVLLGLLTITLLVNPLNQEIEEALDAPQRKLHIEFGVMLKCIEPHSGAARTFFLGTETATSNPGPAGPGPA